MIHLGFRTRLALGCAVLCALAAGPGQAEAPESPGHVPGQVLVGFSASSRADDVRSVVAALKARDSRRVGPTSLHVVTLPSGADEQAAVAALRGNPHVVFAELDEVLEPAATTNDPLLGWQWHLAKIRAPQAWDVSTGPNDVVIAILDTGVDVTHPDLAPIALTGWNFQAGNADVRDAFGHGTAVAGAAAAAVGNGTGIAATCWRARILPVRVSDQWGYASLSAIADGLVWAADGGARVANVSYDVSGYASIAAATAYFESKGGVVTVSSGNDAVVDSAPDDPHVLTVGATDASDFVAGWSNRGTNLDLVAPGVSIWTTNPAGGGYSDWNGTSFSAPVVAGAAALLISTAPELPAQHVMSILRRSAADLGSAGWDGESGAGRLDVAAALQMALAERNATAPIVEFATALQGAQVSGTVPVRMEAASPDGVARVVLRDNGQTVADLAAPPYDVNWDTSRVAGGSHVLEMTATDTRGRSSSASVTVSVLGSGDVTPPSVSITSPSDGYKAKSTVDVYVSAWDDKGVVRVDLLVDGKAVATSTKAPFTTSWRAKRGSHQLQCQAVDAAGNVGRSQTVTVVK